MTDPEEVQEVIGSRFSAGPIVICDKCKDATQTIVAGIIFTDDSEPPLLLCQVCLKYFESSFDPVEE